MGERASYDGLEVVDPVAADPDVLPQVVHDPDLAFGEQLGDADSLGVGRAEPRGGLREPTGLAQGPHVIEARRVELPCGPRPVVDDQGTSVPDEVKHQKTR